MFGERRKIKEAVEAELELMRRVAGLLYGFGPYAIKLPVDGATPLIESTASEVKT